MKKHVLITGGTDGIGKVTARRLVEAGLTVTILGRDEAKTKKVAKEIEANYVVADVSDYDQVATAVEKAERASGPVDILINNAGVWLSQPLAETNPELIKRTIEINTLGTIYLVRAVAPSMQARKSGRIINVVSQAGFRFSPDRTVYHASKWAITGFTKALQQELRVHNISVVGFYPGAMNTQFFAKAGDVKDRSQALAPELAADALVHLCTLPDSVEVMEYGLQSLEY
ncbi:MAG TPA: SDR family oxidoreductase, partial [Candidatus Saccharimonadales bacterium]|nr:SDR family oxidoreductase [Candidatus Saccharimonadales bacterium]